MKTKLRPCFWSNCRVGLCSNGVGATARLYLDLQDVIHCGPFPPLVCSKGTVQVVFVKDEALTWHIQKQWLWMLLLPSSFINQGPEMIAKFCAPACDKPACLLCCCQILCWGYMQKMVLMVLKWSTSLSMSWQQHKKRNLQTYLELYSPNQFVPAGWKNWIKIVENHYDSWIHRGLHPIELHDLPTIQIHREKYQTSI